MESLFYFKMHKISLILVILSMVAIDQYYSFYRRRKRRDYYRNIYLKSDEWKRKRFVVLKRDQWRCVYCGETATEVHHKRYARNNIGKEPISWLVSVCRSCHESKH